MPNTVIEISLKSPDASLREYACVAIAMSSSATLSSVGAELDGELSGAIAKVLGDRDFRGGRDEVFQLTGGAGGPRRVLLIGMGSPQATADGVRRAAAVAARRARESGCPSLLFVADFSQANEVEAAAVGLMLGGWHYSDLKTAPAEADSRDHLARAEIAAPVSDAFVQALNNGVAIGTGQSLTRTLGMMPGNLCTPQFLATTARDIASRHGLDISVLGRSELETEGMGAMLAVAQGTPQDPQLIVLHYNGGEKGSAPIVLVGKGLCFDTGGISIKPAKDMEQMKYDMSGGGAVLGAMEAIARMGLKANVVGMVGATTNMPSGEAYKPGDVIRAHSGRYIEVINTDAEGRLVLADMLSYARRFEPSAVIDAATLTGAVVVALGHLATGVFGTDAELVRDVLRAGSVAGEKSWELPLWDEYREIINSSIADVMNSGGRDAGSITAAMFLRDFAVGYPWVHMDVAGTAYSERDLVAIPEGPTGVPVGTFVEFVRSRAG